LNTLLRATIYFKTHVHLLQDNMNMEAIEEIKVLVESEVPHTHIGEKTL
jgi:hypothetical protein